MGCIQAFSLQLEVVVVTKVIEYMWTESHLAFVNNVIYLRSYYHGRDASSHQPVWKHLRRIRRYRHYSKFSMVAAAILDFHDK